MKKQRSYTAHFDDGSTQAFTADNKRQACLYANMFKRRHNMKGPVQVECDNKK